MFKQKHLTTEEVDTLFRRAHAAREARQLQAVINDEIVRVVDGRTDEAQAAVDASAALGRLQEQIRKDTP